MSTCALAGPAPVLHAPPPPMLETLLREEGQLFQNLSLK